MIKLGRILEQTGIEGQYYDLGKDFANFRRTIDGTGEQIKKKFEQSIGAKLVGKRIRARASRGYKQYVKDYEFDVVKITLDDYYDNYVVVAHDNSTPKAKEYFLKPGFKVQVLGPATGQPSPQKGGKPTEKFQQPQVQPQTQSQQPTSPSEPSQNSQDMSMAPAGHTPSEPVKEQANGFFDAYSIDKISNDINSWLPIILIKPETALRDFIKGIGWEKDLGNNVKVALFELKIPMDAIKQGISLDKVKELISRSQDNSKYEIVKMDLDNTKGQWNIRIKKTTSTT